MRDSAPDGPPLAAPPERRFRRALVPGCENRALAEQLADRCDEYGALR